MRAGPAPLHLVLFGKPLGDDGLHFGLDECPRDTLTRPVALAVIDQAYTVRGDAGPELADGHQELALVRVVRFETFRVEWQVADFHLGTVGVVMPKMPFDPAQGFKQVLSSLLVMVFEPLRELAEKRDVHGDMEPVEDMLARRRDQLG